MRTMPLNFVSIDIETRNLTEEQIITASQFLKAHPGTKDEEKKAAQIAAKKAALSERGALTDTAEIASIAIWTDEESDPMVFHTFDCNDDLDGIDHLGFKSEKEMLETFQRMMNDLCGEQTEVVVANAGFDLPKLRYAAAIRNHVKIPEIIKPRAVNPVYDVLYMAGKYFLIGSGQEFNLSLDELARHLGLSSGKLVSGKEIPAMIDAGEFKTVITYNAIDALLTGKAYQILSGRF